MRKGQENRSALFSGIIPAQLPPFTGENTGRRQLTCSQRKGQSQARSPSQSHPDGLTAPLFLAQVWPRQAGQAATWTGCTHVGTLIGPAHQGGLPAGTGEKNRANRSHGWGLREGNVSGGATVRDTKSWPSLRDGGQRTASILTLGSSIQTASHLRCPAFRAGLPLGRTTTPAISFSYSLFPAHLSRHCLPSAKQVSLAQHKAFSDSLWMYRLLRPISTVLASTTCECADRSLHKGPRFCLSCPPLGLFCGCREPTY